MFFPLLQPFEGLDELRVVSGRARSHRRELNRFRVPYQSMLNRLGHSGAMLVVSDAIS